MKVYARGAKREEKGRGMGQVREQGEGDTLHWPAPPQQSQTAVRHLSSLRPTTGKGNRKWVFWTPLGLPLLLATENPQRRRKQQPEGHTTFPKVGLNSLSRV